MLEEETRRFQLVQTANSQGKKGKGGSKQNVGKKAQSNRNVKGGKKEEDLTVEEIEFQKRESHIKQQIKRL